MQSITLPNKSKIYTDNRKQVDKNGCEFSILSIEKDLTKPPIWRKISGVNTECWCWIFKFRYTENRCKGFDVSIDHYDNYSGIKYV